MNSGYSRHKSEFESTKGEASRCKNKTSRGCPTKDSSMLSPTAWTEAGHILQATGYGTRMKRKPRRNVKGQIMCAPTASLFKMLC